MSGMGQGCAEELKFASDVVPVVVGGLRSYAGVFLNLKDEL